MGVDIIMLPLARWDGPYSSTAYSLAKEFSKNNRVFYIDNPITLKYFIVNFNTPQIRMRRKALLFGKNRFRKLESPHQNLVAVTPMLTIPVNFLPSGFLYNFFSHLNEIIIARALKKAIKSYSIDDFIFINCFNPFYLRSLPSFFKPKLFIYMSVDEISHSVHIKKHGPKLEADMVKKADLTFVTSVQLKKKYDKLSREVFHLPNAADIGIFKSGTLNILPKPKEIQGIEKLIVIYTGHIDHRMDIQMFSEVVKEKHDFVFLFVGPVSLCDEQYAEMSDYPNVIFTGMKDINELPAYLQYSDCAVIPFKCNELTKSIYPLKINEYLASGKPVVSTPFSQDIQDFDEVISICKKAPDFSAAITSCVNSDSLSKKEDRIKFVENNTWEARVDLFWEKVNIYL